MQEILDHEENKNVKQTFARLALGCSVSIILLFLGMGFQIATDIRAGLEMPIIPIILGVLMFLLCPFSIVFSFISIFQKEPWTIVKIAGVVLSALISLFFLGTIILGIYVNLTNPSF